MESDEENNIVVSNEEENQDVVWKRKQRDAVIQVVAYIAYLSSLIHIYNQLKNANRVTQIESLDSYLVREKRQFELMNDSKITRNCRGLIRMSPDAFVRFCNLLRDEGHLLDTRRASVEKQVAKFLHIVGHNARNFTLSLFFKRSGETTSRHFHRVLNAITSMEDKFLKQPNGTITPPEIQNDKRFFPYFEHCLGAIDGSHIHVKIAGAKTLKFRCRKGFPSQNVLAACTFDLKFTYVLAGWEGSASDSRIVKNVLYSREDKLKIPSGKYYLRDASFMLKPCLITPYRGVRYHLKEYSSHGLENMYELFNHRHASLRNAIERAFGVLKKRFAKIGGTNEPHYSLGTLTKIILACCITHNFLMGVDHEFNQSLLDEVDVELVETDEEGEVISSQQDTANGAKVWDDIATRMWEDYVL